MARRGRPPAIDVARTHDVAEGLARILPPGAELIHSRKLGWILRKWDTWTDPRSHEPIMGWRDVDQAAEPELALLLLRLQDSRHGSKRRPTPESSELQTSTAAD